MQTVQDQGVVMGQSKDNETISDGGYAEKTGGTTELKRNREEEEQRPRQREEEEQRMRQRAFAALLPLAGACVALHTCTVS